MHDLLIMGGEVLDGTGAPPVRADLAVRGGRIAEVGDLSGQRTASTLDAGGRMIAPGFIDVHSHDDFNLPLNPLCIGKIRQGVTTVVTGNCGWSPAPLQPERRDLLRDNASFLDTGLNYQWESLGEFLERMPPLGLNMAQLVGHVAVRCAVMGMDDRPPSPREQQAMGDLVEAAMIQGAWGFSTGLVYPPSAYAQVEEISALAAVAAKHGGGYHTHMRDEGNHIMDSVREAAEIGRRSGAQVQISHLKLHGQNCWGQADELLALIAGLRGQGVSIQCDQYPYPAASTGLKNLLPHWAHAGGTGALMERLGHPEQRDRIRAEMLEGMSEAGYMKIARWSDVMIAESASHPEYNGLNLEQIGQNEEQRAVDSTLDLLLSDYAKTLAIFFSIGVEDMERILRDPHVAIGSDGILTTVPGHEGSTMPHPRYYGTFPRVLGRMVRDHALLSLPEAIRKMTSLPAAGLGLTGRGTIAPGNWADLVLFDPAEVLDRATYKDPHQYPAGVGEVLVAGELVVAGGRETGATPGRILKRNGKPPA